MRWELINEQYHYASGNSQRRMKGCNLVCGGVVREAREEQSIGKYIQGLLGPGIGRGQRWAGACMRGKVHGKGVRRGQQS